MSLAGVLTVIFIVLKVLGVGVVAGWSWWWVLSPLWISILLLPVIFLVCSFLGVSMAGVAYGLDHLIQSKKRRRK